MVVNRFCEDIIDDFWGRVTGDGSHGEATEDIAGEGPEASVVAELHTGGDEFEFFVVEPHVQPVSAVLSWS